jgi:hypothetical protein
MRKKSVKYVCCHEAGHAVLAYLNGYEISEIQISDCEDSLLDDPLRGPFVAYVPQSRTCSLCEARIENRNDPSLLSPLDDHCSSCKQEKFKFIERCFAGPAATEALEKSEHDERDGEFDRTQVGQMYPVRSQSRVEAFSVGLQRARKRISEVQHIVRALRDELLTTGSRMTGEQATRVIRTALGEE